MTKAVRIENADTSSYIVKVQEFEGVPGDGSPPVREVKLNHPTKMDTFYVHSSHYIVITEEPPARSW